MTKFQKQVLDTLDTIDERLKKSERNNNAVIAISFGLTAVIFSTGFFTIEPDVGTAWLLFTVGILAISGYGWYNLFLLLKKKLCESKK